MKQLGCDAAHISHSLNGYRGSLNRNSHFIQYIFCGIHDAPSRGFISSKGASQADWLACNHAVDAVALQHAVGIHHPAHNNRIGAYIRSRDILFRPNKGSNGCRVSSGDCPDFIFRQLIGVADNAALAAAVRNIHHCALECHPGCQGPDLVRIYRGMETHSALGRSAGCGVLHPVSLKYLRCPIVHPHRNRNLKFPLRVLNGLYVTVRIAQYIGCFLYYL